MARLYRPHIPLDIRVIVAARQIRKIDPTDPCLYGLGLQYARDFPGDPTVKFGKKLAILLRQLAKLLGCEVSDLRLDHDPALGARPRHRRGLNPRTFYTPDANDPEHLLYRPHGPEFDGSHLIKTNVRGDHGQHPDRVLIKKERRRQRAEAGDLEPKASRFPKDRSRVKRRTGSSFRSRTDKSKPKPKWPKRQFPKKRKDR